MAQVFARIFVIAAVCLASAPTAAYVRCMTNSVPRVPCRWWLRPEPLTFRISEATPVEVPRAQVPGIMQAAFDAWRIDGCDVPEVSYAGTTEREARNTPAWFDQEPDNVVVFVTRQAAWSALGHSQAELAVTKLSGNPDSGEITDADIEFNAADHTFVVTDGEIPADAVDFIATVQHETGHFFGLNDSFDPTATMYGGDLPPTADDPHPRRTLAEDDRNGICALYAGVPHHGDDASSYLDADDTYPYPRSPSQGSTPPGCEGGAAPSGLVALAAAALGRRLARGLRRSMLRALAR